MVGKKMVLYPLGELMERLGFSEGCEVVFRVEGVGFVVERVESLWELALRSRKWAETSVEEFERESEEEQGRQFWGGAGWFLTPRAFFRRWGFPSERWRIFGLLWSMGRMWNVFTRRPSWLSFWRR